MAVRGVWASCVTCWSLLIFLQLSHPVTSADLTYRIQEEIPAGSKVGDIVEDAELRQKYTDAQVDNFEYRMLDPESKSAKLFNITQTSGILQTRVILDREAICPGQGRCEVSVGVVYTRADIFAVLDILVEIVDVNDNAPAFPERFVTLEIPESASPGATYNLPLARDLDDGSNGVQKYILQADVTNFELKVITIGSNNFPTTLQLILKEPLDREAKPFYQVVVIATDGGAQPKSGALTINITVTDANDHGPVFENETYKVTIPEDQPAGSRILRIEAQDADLGVNGRVLYKFVAGSITDVFEMVENTGEVVLKNGLDYETKQSYSLIVEARDGGANSQPAFANVMITVEDKNDNPPQISINTKNGSSDVASISEMVEAGRFVAHISVKDPDTGLGGRFDCRVNDGHFYLQKVAEGQFKIVTATILDREEKESYQVKVTCDDDGTPRLVSEKILNVRVKDENDNAPIFSRSTFSVSFPENNYINEFIIQVNATDADRDLNAALTYSIGLEGREMFRIEPRTGAIRANGVFDFEKEKMYIFPVIATDSGSPPKTGSALVSVSITDKNDEAPSFSDPVYVFDVLENQPVGMEIGIVSAEDPDSGAFNYFEFSLQTSKASENFAIDTISGHVRTKKVLDREQQGVHHMVVIASNVGITPPLSGSALITVNVLDQNDHAPVIDYPNEHNYSVQISTQSPEGFLVALVQAHDVDTGNNARLTYAISEGNKADLFSIDPSLGAISTKKSLAGMGDKLFVMKITVSDQGFPPKYTTGTLHVMLNSSMIYPYGSDPSKLLNGTNVTIVVSLAIASGIVVIILVIAIVLIRKKEVGRRKQKHMYRYQIETQKTQPQSAENVNEKSKSEKLKPPGGMRRNSQGSIGKSNNKKEVSFNMSNKGGSSGDRKPVNTDHSMNNQTWGTTNDKGKNETKPKLQVPQKWEYSTAKIPGPALVHGHPQGPHETIGTLGGVPNKGRKGTEGLISLPPQQKPWELYAGELQTQYMLEKGGDDHDTDSAYSGDISNTDSGRGPSEEGEPGNPGAPFCTTSSGKPPQSGTPLTNAHVDTLQRLHKWQTNSNKQYPSPPQQQQQQQGGQRYPSHQQGSNKMNNSNPPSKNTRNLDNLRPPSRSETPQKPLPPPRKSSARDSNPMAPPSGVRNGYPPHPGHGYHHENNWRTNNNSFKNWDPVPEDDDGASSTSGSYIVDPTDLYFEGSQPAVMV